MRNNFLKINKGVTVMEAIIGAALVSIVLLSLYSSLTGAMNSVNEARVRLIAVAVANEKMEIFRNLSYEDVGTVGGIIEGPIVQQESIEKNGRVFNVKNEVRYVDDNFDGVFPDDLIDTDYKKVEITVSWTNSQEKVTLNSIFVPNGVETNVGGGTLSINVTNSAAEPVGGVNINLSDLDNDPDVEANYLTDSQGNLLLPGVPTQNYRITLTKDSYETIRTYPNPPDGIFTPINSDLNVVEGALNTKLFFVDLSANLTLKAINIKSNNGISGVTFEIEGGKKIGINPDTFTLKETINSNENGEVVLSDISPGEYRILNESSLSNSQYEYLGMSETHPFNVGSAEDKIVNFIFADINEDSLVVSVEDSQSGEPLEGASVHLSGEGFDETAISGTNGIVFFPNIAESLNPGDYFLEISKSGFVNQSKSVNINNLVKEEIILVGE